MQTTITTERLVLETLRASDHGFILELVNTEGWLQFIGDRNIHSKDDAIRYIQKIDEAQNFTYWVVRTKETGAPPMGIVSFLKRDYLEHFDLGFAFLPS